MSFYLKDPQSRIDYAIDWDCTLGARTISASLWMVTPDEAGGIAVVEESFDLARTAARLSGGRVGHVYDIGNHVTLSDGSVDVRSITVRVEKK
jgi:hypothetical protein